MEIKINYLFKNLLPPQSQEENQNLETSILSEGIREPLILWEDKQKNIYLIDGHHRYEIAKKHKIEFKTKFLEFENTEEVLNWIITNQNTRRNINKEYENHTGSIKQSRQKFKRLFKKGFEIYIRQNANIFKARKDENDDRGGWELVNYGGAHNEENAKKYRDELLENENVIFELF